MTTSRITSTRPFIIIITATNTEQTSKVTTGASINITYINTNSANTTIDAIAAICFQDIMNYFSSKISPQTSVSSHSPFVPSFPLIG